MKVWSWCALVLMVMACKTPADADPEPVEPVEVPQTAAQGEKEPSVAPAEPAFTPVRIPGTPHDEEGTSITLTWVAESGEVPLFTPKGINWNPTGPVRLEQGARIDYEDSVVVVTRPTLLSVTQEGAMLTGASSFSPTTGAIAEGNRDEPTSKTDKVYMLKYAGEGTCYVQRNMDVFLANCPADGFEPQVTRPEAFEWWVNLGEGWLRVDDRVKVETASSM